MYISLMEPYFRYCRLVWGSASSTNLQRLQKIQNRDARIVTKSLYDAPLEPLLKEFGWLTTKHLIDTHNCKDRLKGSLK